MRQCLHGGQKGLDITVHTAGSQSQTLSKMSKMSAVGSPTIAFVGGCGGHLGTMRRQAQKHATEPREGHTNPEPANQAVQPRKHIRTFLGGGGGGGRE